jgi:RNA polymerase sigma-70 factor (ECF subfamily)
MAGQDCADEVCVRSFDDVLAAAARGEEWGFRSLFREYQPLLLRYLRVVAGAEAEDIASETWLSAVGGLARFEGAEPDFRAWLFTIAVRRHIDMRRRQRVRPVTVDSQPSGGAFPERAASSNTERDALSVISTAEVLSLIGRLPPAEADVVALRVVSGLDISDVARVLGKSEGAVRVCSHRGLRRLGEMLGASVSPVAGVTR